MSKTRKYEPRPPAANELGAIEQTTGVALADAPAPESDKADYRIRFNGRWLGQHVVIEGVKGGPEKAREEIHKYLDKAIVGITRLEPR